MKDINKLTLEKQVKIFIQEVCVNTWGMTDKEIKQYCLTVAKQNLLMASMNNDYMQTAKAYAAAAGSNIKEIGKL